MNTQKRTSEGPSISMRLMPEKLTDEVIEDVKTVASDWSSLGVITEIDWEKPYMEATNQLSRITYPISQFDKEKYEMNWEQKLDLNFQKFCLYFLAALVCFLGKWALASLQGLLRDCQRFIQNSPDTYPDWVEGGVMEQPHLFHDFLLLLPLSEEGSKFVETLADMLDYSGFSLNGKPRALPSVKSFLTFGSCLMDRRPDEALSKRYLLAPVRIWWTISTCIPLRPVEFLVTPYDCLLHPDEGTWFLILRRNRIKGTNRPKAYKIQEDYELVKYQVPKLVADCIQEYKELAANAGAERCPLGTLFSPGLHYQGLGRKMPPSSSYYSYANFNYALHSFHEDLKKVYKFEVIEDRPADTSWDQRTAIDRILPGDTRHLALLNAAQEGVQPQTLVEMVRHASVTQTYWYAANNSVLQACATSKAYEKNQSRNAPIPSIPLAGYHRIKKGDPFLGFGGGRCYSPLLNKGEGSDAFDCTQSTGPRGEFGWCATCPYFRRKGGGSQFDPSRYAMDAQYDWEILLKTIDFYRKEVLHEDSLIRVFEQARASINTLQELVIRDIVSQPDEEDENGAS